MGNDSACHWLSISSHPHLCVIWNLWQRFDSVVIVKVLFLLLLELLVSLTKFLYDMTSVEVGAPLSVERQIGGACPGTTILLPHRRRSSPMVRSPRTSQ